MNMTNMTPTKEDLAEMNRKIEALKEKARNSQLKARSSFETQMQAIEDQYELLKAKVNRVSKQTGAAKSEMTEGMDRAWSELKDSFNNASQHLH